MTRLILTETNKGNTMYNLNDDAIIFLILLVSIFIPFIYLLVKLWIEQICLLREEKSKGIQNGK